MKISITLFSMLFSISLFLPAPFAQGDSSGSEEDDNGGMAWREMTVTGTVEDINSDSQRVTLKASDGTTHTFTTVPGVNLDSIKKGDEVSATFFQSVALEVREPTAEEQQNPIQVEDSVISAPPGTNPAAGGLRQIKAVVKVEEQDQSTQTVVVSGPKGGSSLIYVPDRTAFEKLKEGTEAVIIYTEALAVKVEKK